MGAVLNKDGNAVGYFIDKETEVSVKEPFNTSKLPPGTYPSTPQELEHFARAFFGDCIDISREKNARYAGAKDPFKNFRLGGTYGIAIRMTDKVSRLLTLLDPTNTVGDNGESIEDTCKDLANYAMLLSAMRKNENGQ